MSFLTIYVLFICLNIGLGIVNPIIPEGINKIPILQLPSFDQDVDSLKSPTNSSGSPLDLVTDGYYIAYAVTRTLFSILSGEFVINTIDNVLPIEIPSILTDGIKVLILLFLAIQIYSLLTKNQVRGFS